MNPDRRIHIWNDKVDFPVKDENWYKQKKTTILTRWERDIETAENEAQNKGTTFPKEYRFYSLGNTQDFVHIR